MRAVRMRTAGYATQQQALLRHAGLLECQPQQDTPELFCTCLTVQALHSLSAAGWPLRSWAGLPNPAQTRGSLLVVPSQMLHSLLLPLGHSLKLRLGAITRTTLNGKLCDGMMRLPVLGKWATCILQRNGFLRLAMSAVPMAGPPAAQSAAQSGQRAFSGQGASTSGYVPSYLPTSAPLLHRLTASCFVSECVCHAHSACTLAMRTLYQHVQ